MKNILLALILVNSASGFVQAQTQQRFQAQTQQRFQAQTQQRFQAQISEKSQYSSQGLAPESISSVTETNQECVRAVYDRLLGFASYDYLLGTAQIACNSRQNSDVVISCIEDVYGKLSGLDKAYKARTAAIACKYRPQQAADILDCMIKYYDDGTWTPMAADRNVAKLCTK